MEFINYQQVIDVIVMMLTIAVPIGFIFNITEFIVGYLFRVMFPKHFGRNSF